MELAETLVPHLVNGLSLGLLFALVALGFMLIVGVMEVINLAHGSLFALGAYLALALMGAFGDVPLGTRYTLALVAAPALVGVAGMGLELGLRRTYGKDPLYGLLFTFGAALVLEELIRVVWGTRDRVLPLPAAISGGFVLQGLIYSTYRLYASAMAALLFVTVGLARLVRSPFGKVLQAIKQNEARASFIGYHVWLYEWLAFTLSAALAGLAGGLFALAQMSAFPDVMSLHASGNIVMMTLVGGGLVSFFGPLVGTVVFFLARDVLGALTGTWMLWFGLLFMAIVLFRPEGLAGLWAARARAKVGARPAARLPAEARVSAMTLFEARGLHKRFGDRVVLEDVSLAFEAGRLSGIMGPNGAGKTTCFNVLTGRYRPDRGTVRFDGRDITGLPPRAVARLGVSRSFQTMNLFNDYTALENVLMAVPEVRDRGFDMVRDVLDDGAAVGKARAVLERVGLAGRAEEPAARLPYGERRALEIGVALATEPRVLFLDEPTSGLGVDARARLADLVRRLRGEVTLVVIEHDMPFLFGLADEISVIHWGQVIARGTPGELRKNRWVQASNLGALA